MFIETELPNDSCERRRFKIFLFRDEQRCPDSQVRSIRPGQLSTPLESTVRTRGAIAAPFAAWIVKILPVYLLAVCVGGIIIFTNINTLLSTFVDDPVVGNIVKIVVIVLWFALAIFTLYQNKQLPFLSPKKQTNKIDQAN